MAGLVLVAVVSLVLWWALSGGRAHAEATPAGQPLRISAGPAVPVPGTDRVRVLVEVLNEGAEARTFTPLDLSLERSGGELYRAFVADSSPGELSGGVLAPGEWLRGWRTFEVAAGAGEFSLLYQADEMPSAVQARLPRLQVAVDESAPKTLAQLP